MIVDQTEALQMAATLNERDGLTTAADMWVAVRWSELSGRLPLSGEDVRWVVARGHDA